MSHLLMSHLSRIGYRPHRHLTHRVYYLLRLFGRIFGRLANFRELVASRDERVVVSVGQALSFEDYGGRDPEEVARQVRRNLYAARD